MSKPCEVLIVGGGPSGLAMALLLLQRGWHDIVLVERRGAANAFERGKAFNYQLDGRGQRILEQVGIDAEMLRRFGLPNDRFSQVVFNPDGSAKPMSFPALLPGRKTPYWMTRTHMLEMLQLHLASKNTAGAVSLHYASSLHSLERERDGLCAEVRSDDGSVSRYQPRFTIACDGLGSAVRASLAKIDSTTQDQFAMTAYPSPSAELGYKVLTFPSSIDVRVTGADGAERMQGVEGVEGVEGENGRADSVQAADHSLAYCFLSRSKEAGRRMALFALPVPHADGPRNINIILHRSHAFWQLRGADAIRSWLTDSFPQLNFDHLLSKKELDEFAALEPGYFPDPQHAGRVHFALGAGKHSADVLLVGDAARAFPPDLGMGVNSALEDVAILGDALDMHGEDIRGACAMFERQRLPENRALVRLVQTVHPYQYNQVPWRLKLWFLKFIAQRTLNRVSRGLIPEAPFVLTQKHRLNFVDMEHRAKLADAAFYTAILGILLLVLVLF